MLSRPSGVLEDFYAAGSNQLQKVPVLKPNWKYFCLKSSAITILQMFIAAGVTDATLVNLESAGLYTFSSSDDRIQPMIYQINGTYKDCVVQEFAGEMLDRLIVPEMMIDKNPDLTLGGKVLKFLVEYGYAEAYWNKS